MTKELEFQKFYITEESQIKKEKQGYCGEAITRLATFETIYETLLKEQEKISVEMEILRNEGKKSSVKFRELMVKKLNNGNVLGLFKTYGL